MEENKSLQECSEQDIGHDLVLDQTSHGGFFQLSAGGWAVFLPFSFPFPFHFPGKRIFIFLKYTSKTLTAFHSRRRHKPRSCCLRSQKELFFEIRSYIQLRVWIHTFFLPPENLVQLANLSDVFLSTTVLSGQGITNAYFSTEYTRNQ